MKARDPNRWTNSDCQVELQSSRLQCQPPSSCPPPLRISRFHLKNLAGVRLPRFVESEINTTRLQRYDELERKMKMVKWFSYHIFHKCGTFKFNMWLSHRIDMI